MNEPTIVSQAGQNQDRVSQHGPGLNFKVVNSKGGAVVYITDDPTLNTLTLTITNQTGAAVTLKHGAPVPEQQLTDLGPTSLYLSFGRLLTADQFKAVQISAPGWQAQLMTGVITNWALTPRADIRLGDGASIEVTIAHLIVSGQPRPGALTVDYCNVPTVNKDASQQVLAVQTPPTQLRSLQVNVEFVSNDVVYVTRDADNPILNTLVLSIANSSRDTPIVPSNVPLGQDPPVFFLSFVYGKTDGYGALTTVELGKTIQIDAIPHTSDTWIPERVDQEDGSYWRLKPQQHEVLGVGAAGRVGFTISHIISEFKPEPLPTQMYLQWAHIPGYNDGYLSLDITKSLPTPGILTFRSLTPGIIKANDPVQLTWQTFAVARVTLSYTVKQQIVILDSSTGAIGTSMAQFAPPRPALNTTYYLDAYDARRGKVDSRTIPITVITPPITLDSFTASPHAANFAAGPVDITLSWRVTPGFAIKRLVVEGLELPDNQTSLVVRGVKGPTTFHMKVIGLGDDEHAASTESISIREYLVGRRYSVTNWQVWNNPKQIWLDVLEFMSASEARYTASFCRWDPWLSDGRDVRGPWTLVGSTIQVVTSMGTLLFDFEEQSKKGEALRFKTPPFLKEWAIEYDPLMSFDPPK